MTWETEGRGKRRVETGEAVVIDGEDKWATLFCYIFHVLGSFPEEDDNLVVQSLTWLL